MDAAYAFTLFFVTLGPVKTIPTFFVATNGADRRTIAVLATKTAIAATVIVLFVALVASGTMVTWRVSADSMALAGGLMLILQAMTSLRSFQLADLPAAPAPTAPRFDTRWLGRPILSPLTIPAVVTPIGVVAVLYFSGLAIGRQDLQAQLAGILVVIMALNLAAMRFAAPIMRAVGLPVLQVIGWVFSALQAGLGIQLAADAIRRIAAA